MPTVHLVDYVAGNIRSLVNAIEKLGWTVEWIRRPEDVAAAETIILPGVGHFGHCLSQLAGTGYLPGLRAHIEADKPFMGICVGMQALLDGSDEDAAVPGLGLIAGTLRRFSDAEKPVPHIGWDDAAPQIDAAFIASAAPASAPQSPFSALLPGSKYYYVHSYQLPYTPGELERRGWSVATCTYGHERFVGALARRRLLATQFHPEKSGVAGLRLLRAFLSGTNDHTELNRPPVPSLPPPGLTRRVIACLDVRANDAGDLVVTKGDQYDVREPAGTAEGAGPRAVRNLGKPVDLARRYYEQGADEVAFLNITSFRDLPLADLPMLEVLRRASETVFVPLTVGGGIRDTVDPASGAAVSALQVAAAYFASGADKVSIGTEAVLATEAYRAAGGRLTGQTAIETISRAYGRQAVVVSVDPRRVWVADADRVRVGAQHALAEVTIADAGPAGEHWCWWACTVRGGRETRDVDVVELARAVEAMGAGELLLNSIDRDGSGAGFDLDLVRQVKAAVRIPVIASSGAGSPAHFVDLFGRTTADAGLGAGMFHRGEYTVQQVKDELRNHGLVVRQSEGDL